MNMTFGLLDSLQYTCSMMAPPSPGKESSGSTHSLLGVVVVAVIIGIAIYRWSINRHRQIDIPYKNHVSSSSPSGIRKGRLTFGFLTLIFGAVLLGYSLFTLKLALDEPSPMHRPYPHEFDPTPAAAFSAAIILLLAIVFLIAGLIFIIGGARASRLYVKLGLSAPHKANINNMPTLLVISALWHLSSIGLFAYMILHFDNMPDSDGIFFVRVVLVFMQYGVFTAIMAPFCARGQRWALWTTFVVFGLNLLWRTLIYAFGSFLVYQGTVSFSAVFDGRVLYWILTGSVAAKTLRWLRVRPSASTDGKRSTPQQSPPVLESTPPVPEFPSREEDPTQQTTLKFHCPHCGQHLEAEIEMAGGQTECPTCNKEMRVPES